MVWWKIHHFVRWFSQLSTSQRMASGPPRSHLAFALILVVVPRLEIGDPHRIQRGQGKSWEIQLSLGYLLGYDNWYNLDNYNPNWYGSQLIIDNWISQWSQLFIPGSIYIYIIDILSWDIYWDIPGHWCLFRYTHFWYYHTPISTNQTKGIFIDVYLDMFWIHNRTGNCRTSLVKTWNV